MVKLSPPRCPHCQSTEVFVTKYASIECQACGTKTTKAGNLHPIKPGKFKSWARNPKGPLGTDDINR